MTGKYIIAWEGTFVLIDSLDKAREAIQERYLSLKKVERHMSIYELRLVEDVVPNSNGDAK